MRIVLSLFLLISIQMFSQKNDIDQSFFEENAYYNYLGEDAVVEYDKGSVYFKMISGRVNVVTETSTRIKILNTNGFQYATVQIPLYRNRYKKEMVSVTEAYTYNLENNKIVKTKLDDNSKFLENYSGDYWYTSFTMPNVKVGSIIEYKTKVSSPYPEDVPEWFFQKEIPVKFSQFTFEIPPGLQFKQYLKGIENIKQENIKDKYVFTAENLPAIKNEGFVSNIDNYRTSLVQYYNGYRLANGETKFIASSWDDVVKMVNTNERFGARLENINFFKPIVYDLIKGKLTDEEKLNAIFDFIQKNFEWNEVVSIVSYNDLKTVYESKKGTTGELNLLLTAMFRAGNIDAHPIILATRNKGISYMPHTNAFNNVIVGVNLKSKLILLDASNKFSRPNIIPLQNANWIGRMINKNGYSREVDLEPKIDSKSNTVGFLNFDLEDNFINGTLRTVYSNYEAFIYRSKYQNLSDEKRKLLFESKYKVEVDSMNIKNIENIDQNVVEFFKIKREHAYDRVGDKIYFNPTFIFKISSNPFKKDSRSYPIDFLYPNKNSYTITFRIPEGYAVDYVPISRKIILESNSFSVGWNFIYDEKNFQIKWNIDYNKAVVGSHEYPDIKKVYEELVKFMDEKIVLKRI